MHFFYFWKTLKTHCCKKKKIQGDCLTAKTYEDWFSAAVARRDRECEKEKERKEGGGEDLEERGGGRGGENEEGDDLQEEERGTTILLPLYHKLGGGGGGELCKENPNVYII